jgi:hypothetical protein
MSFLATAAGGLEPRGRLRAAEPAPKKKKKKKKQPVEIRHVRGHIKKNVA